MFRFRKPAYYPTTKLAFASVLGPWDYRLEFVMPHTSQRTGDLPNLSSPRMQRHIWDLYWDDGAKFESYSGQRVSNNRVNGLKMSKGLPFCSFTGKLLLIAISYHMAFIEERSIKNVLAFLAFWRFCKHYRICLEIWLFH